MRSPVLDSPNRPHLSRILRLVNTEQLRQLSGDDAAYPSITPLPRSCLHFFLNCKAACGEGSVVAAGDSIWTWGVCPLVRSACSCSSALARQAWIFGRSIPGSSETAAVRRFGGSVRRTLARSRWTRPHHPRRCASANVGITPILGIASSLSFQSGTALKGQPLSVRRGSGLGAW